MSGAVTTTRYCRYQWNNQLRQHGVCAFIAPRGSGKSTLMRYVLYEIRKRFDLAVAFVGSPDAAAHMQHYIHKAFVFSNMDSAELNDRLEAVVDEAEALAHKGTPRRVCIILEDLGDDRRFMRANPSLKRICARGRHSGITLIFSAQHAHQIPPEVRCNLDTLAFLYTKGEERESIRKAFFSSLNKREFDFLVERLCINFQAIVLDTTRQQGDLSKCIFFTKAPLTIPPFTLLSPVFRAIAKTMELSESETASRDEQLRRQRKVDRARRMNRRCGRQTPIESTKQVTVAVDADTIEVRSVPVTAMDM